MRSPDGVLRNPMLDKNNAKSISKTSLKHMKFVSLTNDAVILSRSRAKNQARSTLHRQLPPNTKQESLDNSSTQDSKQLFNNLYIRESKKNLLDHMKLLVSSTASNQTSLKNLLIEQRQLSKSTLEEVSEKTAGLFSQRRPQVQPLLRLASNESERELARKLIKQIPQKIKIVDTHANRYMSQPRGGKQINSNVFPITIRNFSNEPDQKDEYTITNEGAIRKGVKKMGTTRLESIKRGGLITVQDHQLVALEPPKIENQQMSGRMGSKERQIDNMQLQGLQSIKYTELFQTIHWPELTSRK